MQYIGTTQETAAWLLVNGDMQKAFVCDFPEIVQLPQLRVGVLAIGPLRIAATPDHRTTLIWNTDYLSATGVANWGFARLGPDLGILSERAILAECFERWLYIVNQRLQGLLLDSRVIHKSYPNGAHTCLAGRGTVARQLSIAYTEADSSTSAGDAHSLVSVGPSRDADLLIREAGHERPRLVSLADSANDVIARSIRRPRLETSLFEDFALAATQALSGRSSTDVAQQDATLEGAVPEEKAFSTLHLTYEDWVAVPSSLTPAQRRILASDVLLRQPVRILGEAGSGKTLVMQLLAMRRLIAAEMAHTPCSILYLTHNGAMCQLVRERLVVLGAERFFDAKSVQRIKVDTLFNLSLTELQIEELAIIDRDARETKEFQIEVLDRMHCRCVGSKEEGGWRVRAVTANLS